MSLTKEEKDIIKCYIDFGVNRTVALLLDRLLAENEEYDKKFESVVEWVPDKHCPLCIHDENWNPVSICGYHDQIRTLQAHLDAIKKAAEPIREEYKHNLEMDRSYFAGVPMKTLKEFVEALDEGKEVK